MKSVFEKAIMFWVGIVVTSLMLACMKPAEATQFHVTKDGEVSAYFIGQSADYTNVLLPVFSDSVAPSNSINNHASVMGQQFDYGYHDKGSFVIFGNIVADTGDSWYSSDSMNSDGLNHMRYAELTLPDGTSALLIGFEDLKGGGDLDFNDTMVLFTNVSPVPEPSTYLMMAIGLVVLRFATRSRM